MLKKSKRFIYLLFALNGFAALTFQVVWQRELTVVFGGSLHSTAVILSVYMAGLALGALYFGKAVCAYKNKLRFYGVLQILIALTGLLLIFLAPAFAYVSKTFFPVYFSSQVLYHLISAVLAFAILLVPTTLIGGGFPVLIAHMADQNLHNHKSVGRLYSLNNAGAVFGSVACGFLFIRYFGAAKSAMIASTLMLFAGCMAVIVKGENKSAKKSAKDSHDIDFDIKGSESNLVRNVMVILFMVSGFTSLSYELLYNRTIIYFVGNNTYSFSILVAVFITGLSIGSWLFAAKAKKIKTASLLLALFAFGEMLLALYHILLPAWTSSLNALLVSMHHRINIESLLLLFIIRVLGAVFTILLPAIIFGFLYPLVFRFYFSGKKHELEGKSAGRLSAFNTIGTSAGPLVTGFIIVGIFSVSGAMRFNATISLMLGVVATAVYLFSVKKINPVLKYSQFALILFVLVLSYTVSPANQLGRVAAYNSLKEQLLYYKEGVYGTVSVSQAINGVKELKINGVGEVPTDHDALRAFRMLAHLPFMINAQPKSICSIAFGGGITFGSISLHQLPKTICVEICKDVLDAASLYGVENHGVYNNKKVKIVIMDGRKYISSTPEKFDIITSDSTHPASFDSWILYTAEFYRSCQTHLNPGGVFAQWVPLHDLASEDFKSILKTFSSQFKYSSLYLANNYTIIIGADTPLEINKAAFEKCMKNRIVKEELASVNIRTIDDVKKTLLMANDDLKNYAHGARYASDDHTPLQFTESRSFSIDTIPQNMAQFKSYIESSRPASVQAEYIINYLEMATLFETGEHNSLLDLNEKLKNSDPEMQYLVKKVYIEHKSEYLSQDTMSKIVNEPDPDTSVQMVNELVKRYPDDGIVYSLKGYVYYKKKNDLKTALDSYDKAFSLSQADKSILDDCGRFFSNAGKYEKALVAFKRLNVLEPNNQGFAYNYVSTLLMLKKTDEARQVTEEFRRRNKIPEFASDIIE